MARGGRSSTISEAKISDGRARIQIRTWGYPRTDQSALIGVARGGNKSKDYDSSDCKAYMVRAFNGAIYLDGARKSSKADHKFFPNDTIELDLRLGDGKGKGELWCKNTKTTFKIAEVEPGSDAPYYVCFQAYSAARAQIESFEHIPFGAEEAKAGAAEGSTAAAAVALDPFKAGPDSWCAVEDKGSAWDVASAKAETRSALTIESSKMAFVKMRSGLRTGGTGLSAGVHKWTIRTSGFDASSKTMLLGICKADLGSGIYSEPKCSGVLVRGHNGGIYKAGHMGKVDSKLMFGPNEDVKFYLNLSKDTGKGELQMSCTASAGKLVMVADDLP